MIMRVWRDLGVWSSSDNRAENSQTYCTYPNLP